MVFVDGMIVCLEFKRINFKNLGIINKKIMCPDIK